MRADEDVEPEFSLITGEFVPVATSSSQAREGKEQDCCGCFCYLLLLYF